MKTPFKVVPVCPNAPLPAGIFVLEAVQECIPVVAVLFSVRLNGDHVLFSSVTQAEESHTGQCMENMVGGCTAVPCFTNSC
jgi:hypothetical protein